MKWNIEEITVTLVKGERSNGEYEHVSEAWRIG